MNSEHFLCLLLTYFLFTAIIYDHITMERKICDYNPKLLQALEEPGQNTKELISVLQHIKGTSPYVIRNIDFELDSCQNFVANEIIGRTNAVR